MACNGKVTVTVDKEGHIANYVLECSGSCPGDAECTKRTSTNHQGGERRWCGCRDVELPRCHIAVHRLGKGEGHHPGHQYIMCAGSCPEGHPRCRLRDVDTEELLPTSGPEGYWLPQWKLTPKWMWGKDITVECACYSKPK